MVDTILVKTLQGQTKSLRSRQVCPRSKIPTSGHGALHECMPLGGHNTETKRHHLRQSRCKFGAPPLRIANSLVHIILVDNRTAVNILYWHAYHKIRLTRAYLSPTTSPLYGFTRGHVIPKGTIKLEITLGEHPWVTTIMTEFLKVNYPLGLQRGVRQAAVTGHECNNLDPLPNREIPYYSGNRPSSRKIVGL